VFQLALQGLLESLFSFHAAVPAQGKGGNPVFSAAPGEAEKLRTHAYRKSLDLYAYQAGGQKVSQLMDENDDGKP
jgi:hypothetical protein